MVRTFYKLISSAILVAFLAGCATPQTDGEGQCEVTPLAEPVACPANWDPVCGCDGKTYSNACSARGAGVSSHSPGECEQKLD